MYVPRVPCLCTQATLTSKDGPIFSLKLGDSTTIVLADGYVIRDLVDLRGGNYAHRPNLWVRELFDDSRIIMRGYDDLWKLERKMYHASLNISVAKQYLPYQVFRTSNVFFTSIGSKLMNIPQGTRILADDPRHDSETRRFR